jgi:hypothetical protein
LIWFVTDHRRNSALAHPCGNSSRGLRLFAAKTVIKIEVLLLARGWVLGLGLGRERSTALAAAQVVEVNSQKISGMMNEAAMPTLPFRHGKRIVNFTGHDWP